jgi:hypothetical protein
MSEKITVEMLLTKLRNTQGPLSVNEGILWFDNGESISLNEVQEDCPFIVWEGGEDIGRADSLEKATRLGVGLLKSGSMEHVFITESLKGGTFKDAGTSLKLFQ